LANAARAVCPGAATDELRLVTAMCWLGPSTAGIPPTHIRAAVLELLRQLVADEQERGERVMEFAIAYGCGKWREVQPGSGGWEHRWQGAMRGLARALEPAVGQSNRWLAEHVPGFPQDRATPHDPNFIEDTATWSDAWMLVNQLARPEDPLLVEEDEAFIVTCVQDGTTCTVDEQDYERVIPPGAKAVWTVHEHEAAMLVADRQAFSAAAGTTLMFIARDEDVLIKAVHDEHPQQTHLKTGEEAEARGPFTLSTWECTCGTTHCGQRHRLEAWDPMQHIQRTVTDAGVRKKEEADLTLWNFVASAVKGPQPRIQTDSFVQGMYTAHGHELRFSSPDVQVVSF
jgi:uncharacterized cupin superfamily protein